METQRGGVGFLSRATTMQPHTHALVVRATAEHMSSIAGRSIPAGVQVAACLWLAMRREDLWPRAAAFRPERWLEPRKPDAMTWIPFGGGTRRCLGAQLARIEAEMGGAWGLVNGAAGGAYGKPEDIDELVEALGQSRFDPLRAPDVEVADERAVPDLIAIGGRQREAELRAEQLRLLEPRHVEDEPRCHHEQRGPCVPEKRVRGAVLAVSALCGGRSGGPH